MIQNGYYLPPILISLVFGQFPEARLLARNLWVDMLADGEIKVVQSQCNQSPKLSNNLTCCTIGVYLDLYITTELLILLSVMEEMRQLRFEKDGRSVHTTTLRNLPGVFKNLPAGSALADKPRLLGHGLVNDSGYLRCLVSQ